jgi:hypothetical protein
LADVLNAGAIYEPFPADTPEPEQVHADDDLVTNTGWHASALLVDTIKDIIVKKQQPQRRKAAAPRARARARKEVQ